ncbi:MAG: Crp/Fnr family transcriptional regulator [Bacteroidota bacterium]
MNQENGLFIKKLFDPYFIAPIETWSEFANHMVKKSFKKNEILKEEHKIENSMHIIIKGSVGVFLWHKTNMKCLDIFAENDFCSDYMSFLNQESTPLQLMALEDVEVVTIPRKDVVRLYYDNITGLQIVKAAAESLFIHKQRQQIDLLTLSAEERYHQLMQERPELINRISIKHIASFLGIAPESMSRIRGKFGKM